MQPEIRTALEQLLLRQSLDGESIERAIGALMDGRCSAIEAASLLTALAVKGETEEELAGAAAAMRRRASRIHTVQTGLMDTCGTGGDKLHTFNISTATAIVIAGAGVPVAKHGNRSVSSSSGSADVLEALGVNIDISADQAGKCLDAVGICFCYARTCHSAMKHVAAVRQELGFRTVFNMLGPLTNPAQAPFQLLGASRNESAALLAGATARLGIERALVVCGNDQLDEVSLWGQTQVWDVQQSHISSWYCSARDFGLPECQPEQLTVSSAQESAEVIREILAGSAGPNRNIVLANAATALYCRGEANSLEAARERAAAAIDDGRAAQVLQQLVQWTRAATPA
jgi:anthranilate phosphoribosyltransferase